MCRNFSTWLKFIISLILAALAFYGLHFSHGQLPALGNFVNPFSGFWQNNKSSDVLPQVLDLDELRDSVVIVWDERHVPHIFARNDHDLYLAQGYVHARDRLWQMEFQTHAVAGRLSEIIGPDAIEYDRCQRRTGFMYAAENALEAMHQDARTRTILEAYAAGVNAYINTLQEKHLPLEYKLLDYRPEPWTPLKTALLIKYMAWYLSAFIYEIPYTRARKAIGEKTTLELYPIIRPDNEPIVPVGTTWPFWPRLPRKPYTPFSPRMISASGAERKEYVPGSNNWAISGEKTFSGHPILCNDAHLDLQLPSLWYENQLIGHQINVYGASLPGAPGVIIGFNKFVAWGLTNAGTDVMDWYEITFKDDAKSMYRRDGKWVPTSIRIDTIRVKGEAAIVDTTYYTHHGPVVYLPEEIPYNEQIPAGCALRWTGHDPSNEALAIILLNKASNYDDYKIAVSLYDCPAQNIAFASRDGDIVLWHCGKFPLRWAGQGLYIMDGSNSAHDWRGWIPREHIPRVENPLREFVSSANQYPVGQQYPYFLNGDYVPAERGKRINLLLADINQATPQQMMALQCDVHDLHAEAVVPVLLSSLDTLKLNADEMECYHKLTRWSYEYRAGYLGPTIFDYWWQEFCQRTWLDDIQFDTFSLPMPRRDITRQLIVKKPESAYFDNKQTGEKETIDDIALQSFKAMVSRLIEDLGQMSTDWQWGKVKGTDIIHLLKIPALGRYRLATDGSHATINVKAEAFGPSWRMIVALGNRVQGWSIYPGGQSGHPGSAFYDNFVDDWVRGMYYEVHFLNTIHDREGEEFTRTILRGAS